MGTCEPSDTDWRNKYKYADTLMTQTPEKKPMHTINQIHGFVLQKIRRVTEEKAEQSDLTYTCFILK